MKQRKQYVKYIDEKHCGLTDQRVQALNDIGFDWGVEELPKKSKSAGKGKGKDKDKADGEGKKKNNKGWDDLMQKKHNSWMVMLEKLKEYREENG